MRLLLTVLLMMAVVISPAAQERRSTAAEKALDLILRGEFREAAGIAAVGLKARPSDVQLRVLLARAEMGQGNLLAAFDELRRALDTEPRNIDALFYLALVAEALAPREFDRLYRIKPDSDRVHQLMAEAALVREDKAEAEAEYRAALRVNPRSIEALIGLAELKRSQSQFGDAIGIYQDAESLLGLNHDIAYGLGVCYAYQQDHAKAIEYFRKALNYEPDADATLFGLGNSYFQIGQVEASVEPLKRAVTINPKLKQAFFLLGRAYQRLGRRELSGEAFRRVDELTKEELRKEREPASRLSRPDR